MSKLLVTLAFVAVAACAKQTPPPTEPSDPLQPADGAPMSPDECTAQGGQVRGDIGDGKIACADGERTLGRVSQGIEGAICCAAP